MSDDISGDGLDVTWHELAGGQKLFNRYRLVKTLGRGGMGIVWLANDEELERDVALKFLPDLVVHDRAVLGELKRETCRSLELTHKNIVRIYDFVHDNTSGCISMEYIDGDTLSNLRADKLHKIFEPDDLRDWVAQLCDALDYAHHHARIVHRDLKPANLMVNQRGELKVADFGIARSLSDSVSKLTMQQGKSGTLVYMSPQQLEGERGTPLDDIYSVGASLYELLTSRPPFYSGNIDRQIREKIPPPLMQRRKELEIEGEPIDPSWEEVTRACLSKHPEKRPQSITEIANRLELPSPKTRRTKSVRAEDGFKRWIPLVVTAAAVLVVGAGGWLAFRTTQKSRITRSTSRQSNPVIPTVPAPTPTIAARIFGSAIISTSPSGATVTLGNKQLLTPAKFDKFKPGVYPLRVELNGYEVVEEKVDVRENQSTDLGTITLRAIKPPETASTPAKPSVIANALYTGMIRIKSEPGGKVTPITIAPGPDLKSGTMAQTSHKGDMLVKYTGIWEGDVLRAVTNEIISRPNGVAWEPEAFTLLFSKDGKNATYECNADGKTYVADLTAQTLGSTMVARLNSIYKGTITGGIPLTITFSGDRKSGTMTQTAKSGDVVVKFAGVWDGSILRAVTSELVSKPAKVNWEPESFTLQFSEDGKNGSYECNADGKFYTAQLSLP